MRMVMVIVKDMVMVKEMAMVMVKEMVMVMMAWIYYLHWGFGVVEHISDA